MKIIKSLHAGVLTRSFAFQGRQWFAMSALWAFRLDSGEPVLEKDMWSEVANLLPADQVLDAGMPKACGEYLLAGNFHAPLQQPVLAGKVVVRVGTLEKTLIVHGDRYWKRLFSGERGIAGPKPVTSVPLTWKQAYGGEQFEHNPLGKGAQEIPLDDVLVWPLPNVEYPHQLVTSLTSRPKPASFGPLFLAWPQRIAKAGTYDEHYLKTRMPGLPDDIDWHFYNEATEDQWCKNDSFWQGDERYELHYLNPAKPYIKGSLPQVVGRCFVLKQEGDTQRFLELPTRMDTVWFFPEANLGIVLHRGSLEIGTSDATDIPNILLAHENRSDERRSVAHYEAELHKRSDPVDGYKYLLNTVPLIPEGCRCGFEVIQSENDFPLDMLSKKNMDRYGELQRSEAEANISDQQQKAYKTLAEAGVDVDAVLKQWEALKSDKNPDADRIREIMNKISPGFAEGKPLDFTRLDLKAVDELNAFIADMAAKKRALAMEELTKQLETLRKEAVEPGAILAVQKFEQRLAEMKLPPPLPRLKIDEQLAQVRQQIGSMNKELDSLPLNDETQAQVNRIQSSLSDADVRCAQMRVELKNSYRTGAHLIAKSRSPHPGQEDALKQRVIAAIKSKKSLADEDFAFVDFSGLNLSGMNFSHCYLEYANFTDANLQGANLQGAIMANATLVNTNLKGADLSQANLGATHILNSCFDGAILDKVILGKADIKQSQFKGCVFSEDLSTFLDTQLENCNFTGAVLIKQAFIERSLKGCIFDEANLSETAFIKPILENASFRKATLNAVNFIEAQANYTCFREALMHNVRFISKCQLQYANFEKARITSANLRECQLQHAYFEGACLDASDCSGSDFSYASITRVSALHTQFGKANMHHADLKNSNLYGASFMEATLTGTDFRDTCMHSANFLAATLGNTQFAGAYLENTILRDWRPD